MNKKISNLLVIKVDRSLPMAEIEIDESKELYTLHSCEEYKYVTALPIAGHYHPVCSKDLKEWCICCGADLNNMHLSPEMIVSAVKRFEKLNIWGNETKCMN